MIVIVKNKMVQVKEKSFTKLIKQKKVKNKIITDTIILKDIIENHKEDFDDSMQIRISSDIINFANLKKEIYITYDMLQIDDNTIESINDRKDYKDTMTKINNILRGQIIWN